MSQPVASTEPVTATPILAAVRLIPSRSKPVGVQGDAAMVEAGSAATAIEPMTADAETRPTSRRLVMKMDMCPPMDS